MLGDAFPELRKPGALENVVEILKDEEHTFNQTLERGCREFKNRTQKLKPGDTVSADDAFMLFTSYGFPVDLTVLMAEEHNLKVDEAGFNARFEQFKQESKGAKKEGGFQGLQAEQTDYLINKAKVTATDDLPKYTWTSTGSGKPTDSKIVAIWNGKEFVSTAKAGGGKVGVFVEKTPFYAESGGQKNDVGQITAKGVAFDVEDVQVYAGYSMHIGALAQGDIKVGLPVTMKVNFERRSHIAKNHTATHLLNYALRKVFGEKVDQKGSLVENERLRFDFAHNKPIELDDLKRVESIVNQEIEKKLKINTKEVELPKAMKMKGLRAVFGEHYPDVVRVVTVGADIPKLLNGDSYEGSIELCGGTHVANSSELYKLVIQSEEGVAKGVRRIVAITGQKAVEDSLLRVRSLQPKLEDAKKLKGKEQEQEVARIRAQLEQDKDASLTAKREFMREVDKLQGDQLKQGKANTKAMQQSAKSQGEALAKEAASKTGFNVHIVKDLDGESKHLGNCLVEARKGSKAAGTLLISAGPKATAICAEVQKGGKINAKEWVDHVLQKLGGKGGGNDVKAQGQTSAPVDAKKVEDEAKAFVGNK